MALALPRAMSHLEENQEYVRMTLENDYAGGEYADGEFSHTGQQGTPQTKEEAIYGVFGNEYETDRRRQRTGLGGGGTMNFVSSGIVGGTVKKKGEKTDNDDEKKEEEAVTIEAEKKPAAPRRPRPAGLVMDRDFGKFSKHTTGFGMKMLMKMGLRENNGRLGKRGTGIVNPVESKLRPKGMGIAFNNFKEVSDKEVYRNAEEEEEAANKKKVVVEERVSREDNWKKGRVKQKVVYKTADDVRKEESKKQQSLKDQVIIDMRGPNVRMTSLDKIGSVLEEPQDPYGDWAPTRSSHNLPELQHNIRLLVDLSKEDIQKLDREITHANDTITTLASERDRLQKRVEAEAKEIQKTEQVMALVKKCEERLEQIASTTKNVQDRLDTVADVMELIYESYPLQWKSFQIAMYCELRAAPLLKSLAHNWQPLIMTDRKIKSESDKRDSSESLVQTMERFRILLRNDQDIYKQLVEDTILPKVTIAFSSSWVCRNFAPAVALLTKLKILLPVEMHVKVVTSLIIPKLKKAVEVWNPRIDTVPVHTWLHPWLRLISTSDMQPVYQVIRYKLAVVLQDWDPADDSAIRVIQPWHGVFQSTDFETLLARSILPKLHNVLRTKFVVNPQRQYIEPFKWVMAWSTLLPTRVMLQLLRMEFFPKWFTALHLWLTNSPNFEEVQKWYMGWKRLFPEALQKHEQLKSILNRALDLMNQALEDPSGIGALQKQILIELKSDSVGTQRKRSVAAEQRTQAKPEPQTGIEGMSFKEIMTQFAAMNGLLFMPNAKRGTVDGKQVYTFGKASIYMTKDCVYVYEQLAAGNGNWRPIALQDLLERAQ